MSSNGGNRNHRPIGTTKLSAERGRRGAGKSKHTGDPAELEFMLQAASRGFPVGKPIGDNEPFDVWLEARSRICASK